MKIIHIQDQKMLKQLESYYSIQIEKMPADIGELVWKYDKPPLGATQ
jgi:hypothetical protein